MYFKFYHDVYTKSTTFYIIIELFAEVYLAIFTITWLFVSKYEEIAFHYTGIYR